jgi:predicted anti-sigma-YlaC factor YlaD
MNCEQVQNLLGRFHDGELGQAERAAVEVHLGNCPSCACELAGIAELAETARSLSAPEPPKDLWKGIAERLVPFPLGESLPARYPLPPGEEKKKRDASWRVRPPIRVTAALAAAVLLAMGAGWLAFRTAGEGRQPIAVDAAVDLGPYLNQITGDQSGLAMSPQEAARQVDFRVVAASELPDGYCLEQCCLCNSSCCPLVTCKYRRAGKDPLLLVQCSQGQPIDYGNRPLVEAQVHGKNARIVQCDGCLCASWKARGTVVNLIGPKDLSELVSLVTFVDQRLADKQ